MEFFTDLFIDGQWRAGGGGERFGVTDPATGSTLAEFAVATIDDCIDAVHAAERAFPEWAATAPRARAEILRRAFDILTAEKETLAELMVLENGKAWPDAMAEAGYATEFFRWFSEEAVRVRGDFRLALLSQFARQVGPTLEYGKRTLGAAGLGDLAARGGVCM